MFLTKHTKTDDNLLYSKDDYYLILKNLKH